MGRILASLGNYLYSTSDDGLWVHFYAQNSADVTVDGQPVQVRLTSNYPWDGAIKLGADPRRRRRHLPSTCASPAGAMNGRSRSTVRRVETTPSGNGYVAITRTWQSGDVVELDLAMPVQAVYANPNVRQMQGRLALQRGPVVYCMEGVDNGGIGLDRLTLDPAQVADFTVEYRRICSAAWPCCAARRRRSTRMAGTSQTLYRRNQPSSQQRDRGHRHPLRHLGQPRARRNARLVPHCIKR